MKISKTLLSSGFLKFCLFLDRFAREKRAFMFIYIIIKWDYNEIAYKSSEGR